MKEGRFDRTGQNRALLADRADITTLQGIHNSRSRTKLSVDTAIAAAATKVPWNTVEWDGLSEYDNTVNYRFQPKVSGYYHANAALYFTTTNVNAGHWVYLLLYNTGALSGIMTLYCAATTYDYCVAIARDFYLSTTDYLEVFQQHTQAGNLTLSAANSFFCVHRFA